MRIQTLAVILSLGYKTFFMLNSAEHEIFSANKYENAYSYCLVEKVSRAAILI